MKMAAIINIAIIFMCISIYKPSETCKPFLVDIEIFHTYKSFYPYDKLCAFKSKA
jgi:hypothetical protein